MCTKFSRLHGGKSRLEDGDACTAVHRASKEVSFAMVDRRSDSAWHLCLGWQQSLRQLSCNTVKHSCGSMQ